MNAPAQRGPFRTPAVLRALFALGLSFALWAFVSDDQGAEILASAPLELRNVPPGLEVVNQSVQEVEVRLRGASGLLRDAPLAGLSAYVDLTDEDPGERTWFLGTEEIEAPPGVTVMRVDPSQVVLQLDRTLTRPVRVSPRVLGRPATGFEIHRIAIEPRELSVEGPESLLRDMEQITTEPISAQGLRETYVQSLQIELPPALRPSVRRVDVRLHIGEEREAHEFRVTVRRAVADGDTPPCTVRTNELTATVRIPRSMVDSVSADSLLAEVSCAGLDDGVHEVTPEFVVVGAEDAPLTAVAFDPETVTVVVGPQ